jgi:hypothetical protein
MEGGNMKNKSFLIISIIVISFLGVHCGQSPLSPNDSFNQAQLNGTVVLSETSTASLGAIQIGVKGTSLYTNPDGNGNFLIENIPTGNIVVEVSVQSDLSDIPIDNVQSGEEIKITVEVQANNQAVLANMERNNESVELLKVEIRPDKWNIAWVDSPDEVTARFSGEGFEDIDPSTLRMICGSCSEPGELVEIGPPFVWEVGGVSSVAKFLQSEAIRLLADPKRDETYTINVTGAMSSGAPLENLSDEITIVGKKSGEGPLSLEIKPKQWNIAWANGDDGDGEVTARITGEDFDDIDATMPILMSGPVGTPISPISTEFGGFFFIAKFSQSQAIALVPNPPQQNSYDITVSFYLTDGTQHVLSCSVPIKAK